MEQYQKTAFDIKSALFYGFLLLYTIEYCLVKFYFVLSTITIHSNFFLVIYTELSINNIKYFKYLYYFIRCLMTRPFFIVETI